MELSINLSKKKDYNQGYDFLSHSSLFFLHYSVTMSLETAFMSQCLGI